MSAKVSESAVSLGFTSPRMMPGRREARSALLRLCYFLLDPPGQVVAGGRTGVPIVQNTPGKTLKQIDCLPVVPDSLEGPRRGRRAPSPMLSAVKAHSLAELDNRLLRRVSFVQGETQK